MNEEIKKYLENKDRTYAEGLVLLQQHGRNRNLQQRLAKKEWPEKLEYELGKLAGAEPVVKKKVVAIPEQVLQSSQLRGTSRSVGNFSNRLVVVRNNRKINHEDLPPEIRLLWDANAEHYKVARAKHEKLKLMAEATAEQREPIVNELLDLDTMIRNNWAAIDGWHPGMEMNKPEEQTPVVDARRISSNRKYISINKKVEKKRDEVQKRITELFAAGENIGEKQRIELAKLGFKFE